MITRKVAIATVTHLNDRARIISLERDCDFKAGQVLGLSTLDVPSPRWYSIASGEADPHFEILFTIVDEGALTPSLGRSKTGDLVTVHGPRGEFFDAEPPSGGTTYWIANGTGVAPFMAMVKSGQASTRSLIQGARSRDEAFGSSLFSTALGGEDSSYTLCLSQSNHDSLRDYEFDGRLTRYIASLSFGKDDRFMLCGSVGMIIDVREILTTKGVRHEAITSEIYF